MSNVLSEPQRALLSTISAGHEVIVTAEKELVTKVTIPRLGTDPASLKWKETTLDTNKQNVSSQIAAMNAATAQVVTLTSGKIDKTQWRGCNRSSKNSTRILRFSFDPPFVAHT